jgi:hypothetical protein
MRRLSFACIFMLSSAAVFAAPGGTASNSAIPGDEYVIASDGETDFGIDVRAQREHQEFEDSSADIDTVSLQPWLQVGNWNFSLDVPWVHAKGEYFVVGGAQPSPKYVCQASSAFLQEHPRLARYVSNTCTPTTTTSSGSHDEQGVGDITVFTHYGNALDDAGIWVGSAGLGYKADSGDVEKGLGSGTQDLMAEGVLGANLGKFSATAVVGYAWIVGGDAEEFADDYAYASLDLAVKPLQWLALGINWDFQQAYVPDGDDVQSIGVYVGFRPIDHLSLRLYGKDYRDTAGYPDKEYGGYVGLWF